MKLYNILLIIFLILTASERIYSTFFLPSKCQGVVFEKWTVYPLVIFHVLIYIFSIIEHFLLTGMSNQLVIILGAILFICSFLLRKWSIKVLGEYESCHIEIRPLHKIIRHGPYKYSKNPRYIANVIEVLSVTLIANAYSTFIFALMTYLPFTIYRAIRENKIMTREIGEDYIKYKHKVIF